MHNLPNIVLFGLCLFGIISSIFVNFFGISHEKWIVSVGFMVFFALPSYIALLRIDVKRALISIGALSLYALVIETIAIQTGFPYGTFTYESGLGPKMFGLVPFAVPFAWAPLVIGSYAAAKTFSKRFAIPVTALLLVCIDVLIDPGAYTMKIWIWDPVGSFYGVPLQNFVGWFGSGVVGASILQLGMGERIQKGNLTLLVASAMGTIAFWLGIASQEYLTIPIITGVVLLYCAVVLLKAQNQQ